MKARAGRRRRRRPARRPRPRTATAPGPPVPLPTTPPAVRAPRSHRRTHTVCGIRADQARERSCATAPGAAGLAGPAGAARRRGSGDRARARPGTPRSQVASSWSRSSSRIRQARSRPLVPVGPDLGVTPGASVSTTITGSPLLHEAHGRARQRTREHRGEHDHDGAGRRPEVEPIDRDVAGDARVDPGQQGEDTPQVAVPAPYPTYSPPPPTTRTAPGRRGGRSARRGPRPPARSGRGCSRPRRRRRRPRGRPSRRRPAGPRCPPRRAWLRRATCPAAARPAS